MGNTLGKGEALRVQVDSGGCHGFQYKLELGHTEEGDIVIERENARVAIDPISWPLVQGATLEWEEELMGSAFKVTKNPNAVSTCGCDVSFELKTQF